MEVAESKTVKHDDLCIGAMFVGIHVILCLISGEAVAVLKYHWRICLLRVQQIRSPYWIKQ